ncbi:DLA class II histocompatibility antigen, DR-1 beta chain-like [Phascolarctos cinereus]
MVCVLFPRGVWTEVLAVTLLVLNSQVAAGRHAPKHFTEQAKSEYHFENRREHVRFVDRYIHNREEFMRFDSYLGEYEALTELGRPSAEYYNSRKEILEQRRAAVDWFCRVCYKVSELFLVHRSVEPEVIVHPSKMAPLGHHNLLICSVSGFYPGDIELLVMLEMTPKHGDVYTCQVEHSSLQRPVMLDWKAQSESAQSKMLSGVGVLVLGLICVWGWPHCPQEESERAPELIPVAVSPGTIVSPQPPYHVWRPLLVSRSPRD